MSSEEERTLLRDIWIENRKQHGFQSKPILATWPLCWEVTERKDTWSDEFLVAVRAYLGAMEVLEMTKEQSEENFERKRQHGRLLQLTSRQPLRRRSPRPEVRNRQGVYGHKGQVLGHTWKHMTMMGETEEVTEEVTEHLTEQASVLMFVGSCQS